MKSLPAAPHSFNDGGAASFQVAEQSSRRGQLDAVLFVGTAGWSISKELDSLFPAVGTHLKRYASQLNAVEINSSFYRPHRKATYERWANSTPEGFRFSVKMPRAITHEKRFIDCGVELDAFLEEIAGLNEKLGVLLVQIPPGLKWDEKTSSDFFKDIRGRFSGRIALEARHSTWFEGEVESQLIEYRISRVGADPPIGNNGANPGGDLGLRYFRWHGSPRMYYSNYDDDQIRLFARKVATAQASKPSTVWCIFDNTAANAALRNALSLLSLFLASEQIIP